MRTRETPELLPVQVDAEFDPPLCGRWLSRELIEGGARLEIRDAAGVKRYRVGWTLHLGAVLGWWLLELGGDGRPAPDAERYDIDVTDAHPHCSCPDGIFRPHRQGGCRHRAALRMALERYRIAGWLGQSDPGLPEGVP